MEWRFLSWGISLFIILGSCIMQSYLPMSGDVGYLLHVTNQLLSGDSYGSQIFETNPPMILYLYLPVIQFIKLFPQHIYIVFRLYVMLLALSSVAMSAYLLKKILNQDSQRLYYMLLNMMLFVFLIVPGYSFGQREHLLFIFMLPYLFSTVVFLENKRIHPLFLVLIGIFSGLGFALKPFFLAPLVLVELYVLIVRKKIQAWFRLETMILSFVLISYLCSIFIFQPTYIHFMLPLIHHFYFIGIADSWDNIFLNPLTLYALILCLAYFFIQKIAFEKYNHLMMILILATVGMIVAYVIPRAAWYYHMIPAISLSCLLAVCYLNYVCDACFNTQSSLGSKLMESFILILFALLFFYLPVFYISNYFTYYAREELNGSSNRLLSYLATLPNKNSVSCFSPVSARECFPLVYKQDKVYASRYPFFWWIKGMLILEKYPKEEPLVGKLAAEKEMLINNIADDLNHYKTKIIIVNMRDMQVAIHPKFDFIRYFVKNKQFAKAWKNYHLIQSIDYYRVYERKS